MSEENKAQIIEGTLMPYYETGMEGTLWSVHEDGKDGYDGLNPLQDGQLLTVFNDAARTEVLWQGVIDLERDPQKQDELLRAQKYSTRLGPWGYGLPKNIHPYDWVNMFANEKPARVEPARIAPTSDKPVPEPLIK